MHKHAHQLINDDDPDCSTLKSGADPVGVGGGGGGGWGGLGPPLWVFITENTEISSFSWKFCLIKTVHTLCSWGMPKLA